MVPGPNQQEQRTGENGGNFTGHRTQKEIIGGGP
jgi:hypothetical protein